MRPDDAHVGVMMSPELQGVINEDDIFGDEHLPRRVSHVQDATGPTQVVRTFSCMVTLSDGEERSGDVLSFVRGRTVRSVTLTGPQRLLDDVATSSHIGRIRVIASSGAEVFDVSFDPADDGDEPEVMYSVVDGFEAVTLRVDVDSYE